MHGSVNVKFVWDSFVETQNFRLQAWIISTGYWQSGYKTLLNRHYTYFQPVNERSVFFRNVSTRLPGYTVLEVTR